jgi:hypothetical protein
MVVGDARKNQAGILALSTKKHNAASCSMNDVWAGNGHSALLRCKTRLSSTTVRSPPTQISFSSSALAEPRLGLLKRTG